MRFGRARCRRRSAAGVTVIEVMIALAILCSAIAASGAVFLSNLYSARSALRTNEGGLFLEAVMQDLSAQSYDALLAMNGNTFFERSTQDGSNYLVTLSVFQAAVDLEQVRAVLIDARSKRELARVSTLRTRR